MNLDQLTLSDYLLVLTLIWLSLLTLYLFSVVNHYKKLTKGTKGADLNKVLEEIINSQKSEKSRVTNIANSLIETQKHSIGHMQKYALVRFNPFEEAGGDQSFCLAILDGHDNGIVISSLHSRSGTRVYAKSILSGKHSTHAFTKEEKETIEKAVKQRLK